MNTTRLPAFILLLTGTLAATTPARAADDEWLSWRGPNGNGVAARGQTPPRNWGPGQNVVWKVPVPGRGHSSPVVVGSRIVLTTADERRQIQSVVCFDRKSGNRLWKTDVSRGGFPRRIHSKNTHATPTVASDGTHLFAVFNNREKIQLTALDLDGKQLWQIDVGAYVPARYKYGYAASPQVYKSTVIVAAESDADSFLAAFDCKSGKQVWRTQRPKQISYSSPIIANIRGRDQILMSGCKLITSYDPANGRIFWSREGICTVTCGTMVWDEGNVYVSGGYPQRATIAVSTDGGNKTVWSNRVKCYEQSMLVHEGYLYAVSDGAVAYCWNTRNGREMWSRRLGGGPISASPILSDGHIYATNERGKTFVFKANPKKFELVATNQLGDETFATPSICGNRIYMRVATRAGGSRQEYLYCLGK